MKTGKYLFELAYEVDVLHKEITTVTDEAVISPQENGTLCYFEGGEPGFYWIDGYEGPDNNRDDFTELWRFINYMRGLLKRKREFAPCRDMLHLLNSPVWCLCEEHQRGKVIDFVTRKVLV